MLPLLFLKKDICFVEYVFRYYLDHMIDHMISDENNALKYSPFLHDTTAPINISPFNFQLP